MPYSIRILFYSLIVVLLLALITLLPPQLSKAAFSSKADLTGSIYLPVEESSTSRSSSPATTLYLPVMQSSEATDASAVSGTAIATQQEALNEIITTEIGDSFVRLRWGASDHEGVFLIDYSIDNINFYNHGILAADTNHYAAGGLGCRTVYYFKVYARTQDGQTLPDGSYTIAITTAPCPGTNEPTKHLASTPPPLTGNNLSCGDLVSADIHSQIALVESRRECVAHFVYLLENNPERYLDAFYKLISTSATDSLFSVVYDELYANRFHFNSDIVESLYANLPRAIAVCVDDDRCSDWSTYILPALEIGDLYECPDLYSLGEAELLQSLPYGDYSCTEATAKALKPFATENTLATILDLAQQETHAWSRRNALRVIGRLGQQLDSENEQLIAKNAYLATTQDRLIRTLEDERAEKAVHEAIWILDSLFYPFFSMQPQLEKIITDREFDTMLRFRAISALSRLIQAKSGLISEEDLALMTRLLQSDDVWVRSLAAFTFEVVQEEQLDEYRRGLIISALESAWLAEDELVAQAHFAKALDHYQGTHRHDELRDQYEATYLANTLSGEQITIRSGLPVSELPAFVKLMENQRRAFFEIMGSSFDTPLTDDGNETITLMLFATQPEYNEYMSAFVGYGAHAGGLYIEKDGILYTYQRDPEESLYTVEELVQHEFSHYLLGRYVYPGLWTDTAYHDELKGWSDEGLAEFLAGLTFDENGNYTYSPREPHLNKLCGGSYRDLPSLLTQSEGYNQAGVFDYANGWSFIYYLMTERQPSALNLYSSFRDDSYEVDRFAEIAGVSSISELEYEWHRSLDESCRTFEQEGNSKQSQFIHSSQEGDPDQKTNENIILHIPDVESSPELIELPPE